MVQQARAELGSTDAAGVRADGRPFLRRGPQRHADSSELGTPEDERLARLVKEAQAGEPLAFADLYVALFGRVHRWLQVALKDREDAWDAAQQVFLRAFEALPRYNEVRGFRPWVFSIAHNLAYDRLHAASRGTHPMDPAVLAQRRESPSQRATESAGQRTNGNIEALIGGLSHNQRGVLRLRFVTDMTNEDIANLLDMTPDAVRHTQRRALRTLARSIDDPTRRSGDVRGASAPAAR
jgi:RNA polymerase sigma-70 factor (ECF subfamily)